MFGAPANTWPMKHRARTRSGLRPPKTLAVQHGLHDLGIREGSGLVERYVVGDREGLRDRLGGYRLEQRKAGRGHGVLRAHLVEARNRRVPPLPRLGPETNRANQRTV